MASYLTYWPLWKDILPLPIFSALISLIIIRAFNTFTNTEKDPAFAKEIKQLFLVVFAMALLGITTGQLTGQSREPAVGAVLPAVLGLIGGISVYLVGSKDKQHQFAVSLAVIAFTVNLLVGVFWGAHLRAQYENVLLSEDYLMDRARAEHNVALKKLQYEKQIQEVRKILELTEKSQPKDSEN